MQRKRPNQEFPKIDRYGAIAASLNCSRETVASVLSGRRSAKTDLGKKIVEAHDFLKSGVETASNTIVQELKERFEA
jgi:hypothetical protein